MELECKKIEKAFKSLARNKAVGFHDLSISIITDAYDSLKNILFYAFKASIQQQIFSDSLKMAKVIPMFKSGDSDIVSNYYPYLSLRFFKNGKKNYS